MKGIQMIGTQRSGSNLLRLILNHHPMISAPHPPHLLKNFVPIVSRYGSLESTSNFHKLYLDMVQFIELNPVPWDHQFERSVPAVTDRSLKGLFEWLYEQHAIANSAEFWSCKSLVNYQYFDLLETISEPPLYVYIYRDGRDVALSFKNAPIGHKHPYMLAKQWVWEQEMALQVMDKLPDERRHFVRYEDLLLNPEDVVNGLLNKVGLKFHGDQLEFYKDSESLATASAGTMWKNVSKPIISSNQNKFINKMTARDIEIYETVAGKMLEKLGYETMSNSNISLNDQIIEEFEVADRLMMEKTLVSKPILVEQRKKQRQHLEIFE